MSWREWFAPKARVVSAPVACPNCGSHGASVQEQLVLPSADGGAPEYGRGFGCPHCAALFGVAGGVVFLYGHKRKGGATAPPPANGAETRARTVEPHAAALDGDMPFRRGGSR